MRPAPVRVSADVQAGVDAPSWGPRNHPQAERDGGRLQAAFRTRGLTLRTGAACRVSALVVGTTDARLAALAHRP